MPDYRAVPDQDIVDSLLVGKSDAMRRLKALLPRIGRTRSNVLIQGESGTGKELVARAVHLLSPRSEGAFVAENCAALPDGVVESELFGHVRGAFTGAERDRAGLIALADGGTLFLDEIGDLGTRVQAKLLRVIQEGEYRPVGGRDVRRSDFRVIAATHRDLGEMVAQGQFREDLYYRLNVVHVRVPPLREKVEDIPLLIEHTLRRLGDHRAPNHAGRERRGGDASGAARHAFDRRSADDAAAASPSSRLGASRADARGTHGAVIPPHDQVAPGAELPLTTAIPVGVSREALEMLLRYPWPGNVRELQNVIEAGLVLAAGGVIGVAELPERIIDHALAEPGSIRAGDGKSAEQVMIELALARFGGDKAKAARHIGWSRPKLYRLMSRHGIAPDFGKPVR